MNSSAQSLRRIASNLLWTPGGLVRNPLAEVASDGHIVRLDTCAEPDREACTEFYPGVLVPGFPADYRAAFERLCAEADTPLPELLARSVQQEGGVAVVISGLDYQTMRLTPRSQIRRI